jgi:hypothetical protein
MAEPHDEGEIPDLGDLDGELPMEYEAFEPISPGNESYSLLQSCHHVVFTLTSVLLKDNIT